MNTIQNIKLNTKNSNQIDLKLTDVKPGDKITIKIDDDGNAVLNATETDEILDEIYANGYVKNTKLHRRWVMAQMFRALNSSQGYTEYIKNHYGYNYSLKMMTEEVRVLGKLEKTDREAFEERAHFFTQVQIMNIINDYYNKLHDYVDNLPIKTCKGVPYKRVKGNNIFVEDLDKKVFKPAFNMIDTIFHAKSYNEIYNILNDFLKSYVHLPDNTSKSQRWMDTYKGEGAYYTLKNLVMFHDCFIYDDITGKKLYKQDAVAVLNEKLDAYQGEGWRMFAFMKKVIKDNNFQF